MTFRGNEIRGLPPPPSIPTLACPGVLSLAPCYLAINRLRCHVRAELAAKNKQLQQMELKVEEYKDNLLKVQYDTIRYGMIHANLGVVCALLC